MHYIAAKYIDDNTFNNKSYEKISGIKNQNIK